MCCLPYQQNAKFTIYQSLVGLDDIPCAQQSSSLVFGLKDASNFIEMIEKRQNLQIGCLEELAYRNKWISKKQLSIIGKKYKNSDYGQYLIKISS